MVLSDGYTVVLRMNGTPGKYDENWLAVKNNSALFILLIFHSKNWQNSFIEAKELKVGVNHTMK